MEGESSYVKWSKRIFERTFLNGTEKDVEGRKGEDTPAGMSKDDVYGLSYASSAAKSGEFA